MSYAREPLDVGSGADGAEVANLTFAVNGEAVSRLNEELTMNPAAPTSASTEVQKNVLREREWAGREKRVN